MNTALASGDLIDLNSDRGWIYGSSAGLPSWNADIGLQAGWAWPNRREAQYRCPKAYCHRYGQVFKICLVRGLGTEDRIGPPCVVEAGIAVDRSPCIADRAVGVHVDFAVFDGTPQPLDLDVVAPGTPTIHADGDPLAQQHAGEGLTGKLAALVGIENLGLTVAGQRVLERLDAEVGFHHD